ncbi:MAG: hypothetical protein IJ551_03470 [Prevotella sp.]|nr:hypothetical protein [Prevotella sp.]
MGVYAPLTIKNQPVEYVPYVYTDFQAAIPNHSVWGENQTKTVFLDSIHSGIFRNGGICPELIVWQRILNPLERLQAESYLALKYGITLNCSYYDANGNLIWDRDKNSAYHHRVAGLTHESHQQSLLPYMSTSSYEYAGTAANPNYKQPFWQNVIGGAPSADHLLVMGRLEEHPMGEGEYLVWGDNQGTLSPVNVSTDENKWHYMNRKWKVRAKTTDSDSACNTAIFNYKKTGNTQFTAHSYGHLAMIIDPSGKGNFTNIDDSFRFAHYESRDTTIGAIKFHDFALNDGEVFTFGWTDSFLAAFTPHEASCLGENTSASDGSIDIDIISGIPHFSYQLKVINVDGDYQNHVIRNGAFTSYNLTITGLKSGEYELIIGEQADLGHTPNNPIRFFSRHVTVGCDCTDFVNGVQNVDPGLVSMSRHKTSDTDGIADIENDSRLSIHPSGGNLTYTAELEATGQAMLLVYTTGGILLSKHHFTPSGHPRTCTFTVPQTDVYIVKAVTATDEYTYKLIAR